MRVAIELTDQQAEQLREHARELGLAPEDLARAAVVDLVNGRAEDFVTVAERVLSKNAELYRRLG